MVFAVLDASAELWGVMQYLAVRSISVSTIAEVVDD
jgi:hypothetical protein